jgi:sigma-B regulation protein RsbU (phosphoserine phosphatase)
MVLLDILMPGIDGYGVLTQMKADAQLRHIPVIMISALDELSSVVRCIEAGAEDYLPKPFNPTLLRARIGACLEKKQLRDQERKTYEALVESQKLLAKELAEAAEYVTSILPAKVTKGPITTDWRFLPSTSLGGDAFGHHWIDDDHLACYLLDVCGHGVGAALLSISAINVIRSQSLPNTDFRRPSQVLAALNTAFPMEAQNDMYFTIWYGVYRRSTRQITHGSAGHNPAVMVAPGGRVTSLASKGPIIGMIEGMEYEEEAAPVPVGGRVFLFSDGTFELLKTDGSRMDYDEFEAHLGTPSAQRGDLDATIAWARDVQGGKPFDDDFSILWLAFA